MTEEESVRIANNLSPLEVAEYVREHWQLKQCLCAQILGVPTGAKDWINRAMMRGDHLRSCEHSLKQAVFEIQKITNEAIWNTRIEYCINCMGTKTINGESCCICHGTGRRAYPV